MRVLAATRGNRPISTARIVANDSGNNTSPAIIGHNREGGFVG
jgi:hypothetical protein